MVAFANRSSSRGENICRASFGPKIKDFKPQRARRSRRKKFEDHRFALKSFNVPPPPFVYFVSFVVPIFVYMLSWTRRARTDIARKSMRKVHHSKPNDASNRMLASADEIQKNRRMRENLAHKKRVPRYTSTRRRGATIDDPDADRYEMVFQLNVSGRKRDDSHSTLCRGRTG